MEVGVVAPHMGGDWALVSTFADRAEDLGFDSVWVADHPQSFRPDGGVLEGWTTLAALASRTDCIGLGVQTFNANLRPPAVLAKMVTTLDLISRGRMAFAIGAGGSPEEMSTLGLDERHLAARVDRFRDTLEIVRAMLRRPDEAVRYSGREASVRGAKNLPAPERELPLGAAGAGPHVINAIAELADAWFCPAAVLPDLIEITERVRQAQEQNSRALQWSVQVVAHVGHEPAPRGFGFLQPDHGLVGSPADVIARARRLADLGFDRVIAHVVGREGLSRLAPLLDDIHALEARTAPATGTRSGTT